MDATDMKALCNREGLLAAFGMVSGVVPARSPKPILQNVKLVASDDEGSTLMGTDLEVGIRYQRGGREGGTARARSSCRPSACSRSSVPRRTRRS